MFRVLRIGPGNTLTRHEGKEKVVPPGQGEVCWIDLQGQDAEHLETLEQSFDFHPLTIEDCAHFDQRPKVDHYGNYLFVVTHGFRWKNLDCESLDALELHAFLGDRYLVTVHTEPIEPLELVMERVAEDPALGHRGVDFLYYLIADSIVDQHFPTIDRVMERLDELEDDVLRRSTPTHLGELLQLKRLLLKLRKVLAPQRDVFALLAKRGEGGVSERTALYFRDIYDHLLRLSESVETARDLLSSVIDAYLWAASERTNKIMKHLTIMSAIFLPLTFVTGFFGQNFELLQWHSEWSFVGMLISCVALPAGLLLWFKRSGWF